MGYTKLVQTGRIIEVYHYEKEPYVRMSGFKCRRKVRAFKNPYDKPPVQRRGDSVDRARKSFRRLVLGNLSKGAPALLTLTMLDIVGIKVAYRLFTAFGLRLKRAYGQMVNWIAVPEFQKRGAVHFHILIWGIPSNVIKNEKDTRNIQNKWGYGYVDIRDTDGSPKLASYLSKYLSKAMFDNRLVGAKAYSSTRNIMRSVSVNSATAIDIISKEFGLGVGDNLPVYEIDYGTLWLGRANYKRYIT